MADKTRIAIIGLRLVGASAGLALHRYHDRVTIVGHDPEPRVAAQAKSMGAVDRTEWNLINAVTNADRVIVALPVNQIRDTLAAIALDLQPGCIVLDTADVKQTVLQWAAELLPESVHFIGGHPILVVDNLDTGAARADLFEKKLFCLTPEARAGDSAVRLAADLVEAMGAQPFFMDPREHDGMAAAVEHGPSLVAGALMWAASSSAAWPDVRKLAGSQFYVSTLIAAQDGTAAASACAANREQTVRWLDAFIAELGLWRERLAAGDDESVAKAFDQGLEAGRRWVQAQAAGDWSETTSLTEIPTSGTFMRGLVGFGSLRKPPAKSR